MKQRLRGGELKGLKRSDRLREDKSREQTSGTGQVGTPLSSAFSLV